MSNEKIKTLFSLAVGFVVFTLFDGLQGIWNGEQIEFDADPDTVAEHAVLSGREDLLPLLKHRRMIQVNDEESKMMEVVYTPQGRPVFQEIPEDDLPNNAPLLTSVEVQKEIDPFADSEDLTLAETREKVDDLLKASQNAPSGLLEWLNSEEQPETRDHIDAVSSSVLKTSNEGLPYIADEPSAYQPVGFTAPVTEKPEGEPEVTAQYNEAEQSVEYVASESGPVIEAEVTPTEKTVDGTEAADAVELVEKTAEIAEKSAKKSKKS